MDQSELIAVLANLEDEHVTLQALASDVARYCPRLAENSHCAECDIRMVVECREVVLNTVSVLTSQWALHTSHEEALMKCSCSPRTLKKRYGTHLEDHLALTNQLAELSVRLSAVPPSDVIADILGLTRRLLDEHVVKHDEQMFRFLNSGQS